MEIIRSINRRDTRSKEVDLQQGQVRLSETKKYPFCLNIFFIEYGWRTLTLLDDGKISMGSEYLTPPLNPHS